MDNYIKNYGIGATAGIMGTLVSHPFFTLKTILQNDIKITKDLIKIRFLYTGLFRAATGYSLEKMLVFGTYNSLRSHNIDPTISGFISGMISSFSVTPFEQLTIDKQRKYKCFSLKHLYSGLIPTMLRESVGFAVHFTVYDYLTSKFNEEKNTIKTMLCGSASVIVGWGIISPFDRIKTQIQSKTFCMKTYNFFHSYHGFSFAIMRAIPFHVTCFIVMEELNKILN